MILVVDETVNVTSTWTTNYRCVKIEVITIQRCVTIKVLNCGCSFVMFSLNCGKLQTNAATNT